VDKVDMKKLGAKFGYTIDGETAGSIENETFSADGAVITIYGVASHPGFARGKMENALKIASRIVAKFPDKLSPEHTEAKEGFIHPVHIEGNIEKATIKLIIRDFSEAGLKRHAKTIQRIVDAAMKPFPNSRAEVKISEQYRNMNKVRRFRTAETAIYTRRNRWIPPVIHGTAMPQYLRRRTRIPLQTGMGVSAGYE
jgi:tripeptide aminopeptidase